MFTEKQKELLKDFGSRCYWHGEDTGDYDMQSVDELLDDLWQEFSLTMLAPDIEPDYIGFLNNEVNWHENNILQDENKEKQSAFINGIRHAIFLIVKAKLELTSRAADGSKWVDWSRAKD